MATNKELQDRIDELELQLSEPQGTILQDSFSKEVWRTVLIGATSSLFNPAYMPLDSRPKALDQYLQRALTVADRAAKVATEYQAFNEKESIQASKSDDPLATLLQ